MNSGPEDRALFQRISSVYEKLLGELKASRRSDGAWEGRLSNSALSTATAISALSFWIVESASQSDLANEREQAAEQVSAGLKWLQAEQNSDGGWGDTAASYSNISTTLLVIAAVHAAEEQHEWNSQLAMATRYVESAGGVEGVRRRYGADKTFSVPILASAAMSGLVPWREVGVLPFEAACVPQGFYNLVRMPVVSYAVPALVAIGQVKFVHDPPRNLLARIVRKLAFNQATRVLNRMQPASGGFLEAIPLTSFVTMALCRSGRGGHPVARSGVRFILESFRAEGSWPIDTNLATWNTTLTINAIATDWPRELRDAAWWNSTIEWLLGCQNQERHPFTGAAPGAWGWTDLSGAVPDADDTPGAMLALASLECQLSLTDSMRKRISAAALAGARWMLDLQNSDGGWPTFCRGWGRFPFDRSGADITAHAIRGLLAWRDLLPAQKIDRAIGRGFRFIERQQNDDGCWFPLWFGNQDFPGDNNPVYGTSKVLMAYRDAGRLNDPAALRGADWLVATQRSNGSWGGGPSVGPDGGDGTIEETSLATEILCDVAEAITVMETTVSKSGMAVGQAGKWLAEAIERGGHLTSRPIGLYFAKLWYDEQQYPLVFAIAALSRLKRMIAGQTKTAANDGF